jgi:hypothetical protein
MHAYLEVVNRWSRVVGRESLSGRHGPCGQFADCYRRGIVGEFAPPPAVTST